MTEEAGTAALPSPYRGIHPFRYADREFFHGRKTLVLDVCSYIQLHRLVVIYGKSGAGKSSLISAGVIPALEKVGMKSERLRFGTTTDYPLSIQRISPGGSEKGPFIASIFDPVAHTTGPVQEPRLSLKAGTFLELVKRQTSPPYGGSLAPTVLFFDQFEELFTRFEERKRTAEKMSQFQNEMRDAIVALAADTSLRLRLVLTIREDFLGHLEELTRTYPRAMDYRVRLHFLSRNEAVTSIIAPFADEDRDGTKVNPFQTRLTKDLAQRIVEDIASGEQRSLSSSELNGEIQSTETQKLASSDDEEEKENEQGIIPPTQVQIVCAELWKSFAETEAVIDLSQYKKKGGVQGILKGYFRTELAEIAPKSNLRRATLRILQNLVTDSNTRDLVAIERLEDLVVQDGTVKQDMSLALEELERHRLINKAPQRGTSYYEVASEYLIPAILKETQRAEVEWARISAEKKAAEEAAARKIEEDRQRKMESLLAVAEEKQALAEAERERAEAERQKAEAERLRAKEQEARAVSERAWGEEQKRAARKFRWVAVGGLAMAAAALVAATVAFLLFRFATNKSKLATSSKLAAMSLARLDDHLDLALLLAREAYATSPTPEAKYSLGAALTSDPSLLAFLPTSGETIRTLNFSPDGKMIVVGSCGRLDNSLQNEDSCHENHIQLWDLRARRPVGKSMTLELYQLVLAFSPDGKTIAIAGCTKLAEGYFCKESAIFFWQANGEAPSSQPLDGNFGTSSPLRFSPDGKLLALLEADGKIILWDVASRSAVRTFKSYITFSVPRRGEPKRTNVSRPMLAASFSQDGKTLTAVDADRLLVTWDVSTGKKISAGAVLEGNENLSYAEFSRDGTSLLGGKKPAKEDDPDELILWDTRTRKKSQEVTANKDARLRSADITADGNTLVMASCQDTIDRKFSTRSPHPTDCAQSQILLWSDDWDAPTRLSGYSGSISTLSFAPTGTSFVTGGDDGTIILWDAAGQRLTTERNTGIKGAHGLDLALDGSWLIGTCSEEKHDERGRAVGCLQGGIAVWNPSRGEVNYTLAGHTDAVYSVAVSPRSKTFASGSKDGSILLWDMAGKKRLGPEFHQSGWVRSLAFNGDGTLLASAGCKSPRLLGGVVKREVCNDGEVHVWVVNEKKELASLFPPQEGIVSSLGFAGLTRLIYTTKARVFETDVYKPRPAKVSGITGISSRFALSPDGTELASFNFLTSSLNLVDLISGDQIAELPLTTRSATGAAFTRDGKQMVVLSGVQGTVWDLDPDSWADRACKIVNRSMSLEEWKAATGNQSPHPTCPESPVLLETSTASVQGGE